MYNTYQPIFIILHIIENFHKQYIKLKKIKNICVSHEIYIINKRYTFFNFLICYYFYDNSWTWITSRKPLIKHCLFVFLDDVN